jgi:hypothetical protein
MKRLACIALAAVVAAGCSTITVNIGDRAIEAASAAGTNAVASAQCRTTNSVQRTSGAATILVQVNMNAAKDIKPDSTLSLTK